MHPPFPPQQQTVTMQKVYASEDKANVVPSQLFRSSPKGAVAVKSTPEDINGKKHQQQFPNATFVYSVIVHCTYKAIIAKLF